MPFKDKETRKAHYEANKERIKARDKVWRDANKDKVAAHNKKWRDANKDKIAAYLQENKERFAERDKAYNEANKERFAARYKVYYEENKEKKTAQYKAYCKTEQGKKMKRMKNWRSYGVNNVNDELYDYFMSCGKCEACGKEFTDTYNKCLDHDHDTGDFRYVLCRSCNTKDSWKKHITAI